MTKTALGRGLNALIPDVKAEDALEEKSAVLGLNPNSITPNRYQPRRAFKDDKQKDLVSSIKENGVIQPVLVRKIQDGYELIAGERRLNAVKSLGIDSIPAIIKDVSDVEALELALIENIQREELNPIDEAQAYSRLISEFNLTQDETAKKVGKERATITNSLRLLKLPKDIQDYIASGDISVSHAKVIMSLENVSDQRKIVLDIIKNKMNVRDTEKAVGKIKEPPVHKRKMAFKDNQIIAIEEDMQKKLGTKVQICQGKKKGKIEIEYYSQEDLQRILDFFH